MTITRLSSGYWHGPSKNEHAHAVLHPPKTGTGWGVCECGATVQVVNGVQVGDWHACYRCCALLVRGEVNRG